MAVSAFNVGDLITESLHDEQHLQYATEHGLVLISANQHDFFRIHTDWLRPGRTRSGIVIVAQQPLGVGEQLRRLERIANEIGAEGMRDRLEFLTNWSAAG